MEDFISRSRTVFLIQRQGPSALSAADEDMLAPLHGLSGPHAWSVR